MIDLEYQRKSTILFAAVVLAIVAPLSIIADWDGQCRRANGGKCDVGWYQACHGVKLLRIFGS
jgi:hypothetical protein